MDAELSECNELLSRATTPGLKTLLQSHLTKLQKQQAAANAPPAAPAPSSSSAPLAGGGKSPPTPATTVSRPGAYVPITDFAWDQGEYNTSTLSIFIDLPGVGAVKDSVKCIFGKHSLDLTVHGLDGKNYRLINENLEKDIVPAECTTLVKANKIVLKLRKVKGEYSYENWPQLTAKKPRGLQEEAAKKDNPMGGIMDMMKDMYDSGDENMKKIIGEVSAVSHAPQP